MESVVRKLRSGVEEGGIAPYAVVLDNVDAIGGTIFMQKVRKRCICRI